jgi:uncharacterized protein YndB with AHSA1/START domain
MGLNVCPTVVVKAPVEVVWSFLANPAKFNEWVDGRVEHMEPEGRGRGRAENQSHRSGIRQEMGRFFHG